MTGCAAAGAAQSGGSAAAPDERTVALRDAARCWQQPAVVRFPVMRSILTRTCSRQQVAQVAYYLRWAGAWIYYASELRAWIYYVSRATFRKME